nr:serine/threonine-protein kinase TOR isoform X2 [Tanacetum cinerariifolium]
MAAQLYRFGAPAPLVTAAANSEGLSRVLADLSTKGAPKDGSALAFRRHIEEEARALSGEAFSRFMDQLYDRITNLLRSNNVADNLGALRATDELIDLRLGDSGTKVSKFSNYIRIVFETKRDPQVLILGSKVLGHLARAGGAMTADVVECQMKNALEWLRGERVEYQRLAAVLILKEMAENASTLFNVHISEFLDAIWVALRDPTLAVRERAVEALRACLRVIEKRETRWRVQWYYRMFEATQEGLGKNAPVHSIHGSLLAVGELLRNSGEFMMSRYKEVAEIVLRYLEHRDPLVRLSITSLLPRIAHFLRDRFVTNYLKICMNHIFVVLKIPTERASGFIALGEMAGALDGELVHYLPTITSHLRDAIAPRRGSPSLEALACIGNIAKAMGSVMETHVFSLLDAMFSAGLSSVLVEALEQIIISIPSLQCTIQDRLLECISVVLPKPQSTHTKTSAAAGRGNMANNMQQVSELNGSVLKQLALQTLARFNFKGHNLLEFARESVILYLEDDDGATRRDAALCCCKLVVNSLSATQITLSRSSQAALKQRRLIEEIVEKLLIAAVADADISVRSSIFCSLDGNGEFDEFLAQADSLTAIFAALNDKDFQVRKYAISVAGRLSEKNPAYVLPALRRHLIQLLTYLGKSADSKCREESAKLLGYLIRSCERLILPYIAPIHKALLAKLCEGTAGVNTNNGIVSGVLVTVGDLARVGGFAIRKYIPELMPRIVDALLDGATKREVAVATLGQVLQSTGYVITPYNEYPQLLGLLLKLLNGELAWSTRREVLKVLGIIGALDPHVHKRNQQSLPRPLGDGLCAPSDGGPHIQSSDDLSMELWPSFATSEDYFSTFAINSLIGILRDPSLSSYHQDVVESLMFIFKSMGLGCVPYLPKVLPDFFHTICTSEDSLKEFIIWKLGTLVSIVRQHIRKYLPELLSLISELWSSFSLPAANLPVHGPSVLHLVEQLCLALNDEFRTYLPTILPFYIQVLTDAERCNNYTFVSDILRTLRVFGGTLDEHMHLLLPALIRLFIVDASVDIRRAAIKTLIRIIPRVQVRGHISLLVDHLKLVLDGRMHLIPHLGNTLKTQLLRIKMHGDETPDAYLNRLREEYNGLKTTITARQVQLHLASFMHSLVIMIICLEKLVHPLHHMGPQAFYGARPSNNNRSNNNNRGNRNNSRGNNNRGRDNGRQFDWASTQNTVYDTCNRCGIGHIQSQCPNRDPSTIRTRPSANFANTRAQSSNASANWHSDTGANSHVTPDLELMDNSEAYYGDNALHVSNAQKSDVYSTFKSFVQMVERQSITKLKNVQTDWGGEFRNLASFFSLLGIIHRRSCPHTSEQNGFVERRNRHVAETGLTVLAQACVPQLSHLSPTSQTSPESSNGQPSPVSTTSIPTPPPPPPPPPITRQRPANLRQNPKQRVPYNPSANHATVLPTTITEPTSFTIANNSPEWRHAMKEEYDALMKNGTWSLVPRASHTNVVDGKWVYRLKQDKNGTITRYKARFVAKGFRQQPGIDFHETFSPVVKSTTIRAVLSLAVTNDLPLRQLDIQNAFLHENLKEQVYMKQPPGFIDPQRPNHVCLLHKSLYGLKQAPCAWFERLSKALFDLGFKGSKTDPSLFIYSRGGTLLYILVYVDDIIVTGNNKGTIDNIICQLGSAFALKDLGSLNYFLGIEIVPHVSGIFLSEKKKDAELRKDAVDALCSLARALGEDFNIFMPSIHKLLLKHHLRHNEFEEIEGKMQRGGRLILGSVVAWTSIRKPLIEVITDHSSDMENDPYEDVHKQPKVHEVNEARLRAAGEASQRSTKEDWAEWMRQFSIELLKQSPSPALRTCARLAQLQPSVGRELFAAGFVSCWSHVQESTQKAFVRSLEMAFSSPNISPEILATLLNLAEFMEHDEKALPIDIRLLGALAEKCRAFAKALHYKELEFEGALSKKMDANPVAIVEALIHINSQLHQHEAAVGILTYAQQHLDVELKESWYEKLQRWDDALKAYTAKSAQASSQHLILEATLGRMRSLAALARWEELNNLCREYWTPADPVTRLEMAPLAANAAWNMGEWDEMAEYVSKLDDGDETKLRVMGNTAATGDGGSNGTFYRAVLLVRRGKYDEAREYVERARKCLATELAALVLESYERAYSNMVRVQQLSELEEVIDYRTLPDSNSATEGRRALIRNMWNERIKGTKRNVEVWQALLAVRSLVLPPTEDSETWLKFASLCRKRGRVSQAKSTLIKLLQFDPETTSKSIQYHGPPQVMLAYLKYQWSLGEDQKRKEAFARLQDLAIELSSTSSLQASAATELNGTSNASLMTRVYLKLGTWQWALFPGLDNDCIQEILSSYKHATHYAPNWAKAWHAWALFNTAVMSHYTLRGLPNIAAQFVVAAVTGYFHSIACAAHAKGVDDSLQVSHYVADVIIFYVYSVFKE